MSSIKAQRHNKGSLIDTCLALLPCNAGIPLWGQSVGGMTPHSQAASNCVCMGSPMATLAPVFCVVSRSILL